MPEARTAPVVCFLHQFADRRVWWRLIEALPRRIRTLVVEQPLTGRIAPPGLTRDVAEAARTVLPDTGADLVVASDAAASAGAELVAEGSAAHGLLINPDTIALVGRPGYEAPALGSEIKGFLEAMAPYHEQLREHGRLSPEGIETLVAFSIGRATSLHEQDRHLLHDIATEHMTRSMPLDVLSEGIAAPPEHNWFARLSADPERYTVYLGEQGQLSEQTRTVVSRNIPGARVMSAPPRSAFPWLEEPQALAALITDRAETAPPASGDILPG